MRPMFWHETDSPVGPLLLAADGRALTRVYFQRGPHPFTPPREWRREAGRFEASTRELAEYFAGERRAFDVPLAMEGSEFQRSVWRALVAIPYGGTLSYGAAARERRPGGGPRERGESPADHRALPPGHRRRWLADRIRRRPRDQARAA